jgi:hypothetical protein
MPFEKPEQTNEHKIWVRDLKRGRINIYKSKHKEVVAVYGTWADRGLILYSMRTARAAYEFMIS